MSREQEDVNRRLLRARDAMDRRVRRAARRADAGRGSRTCREAHFIRTFRATFGETPNRYLQRRRVERAMFLLRATDRLGHRHLHGRSGFTSLGTFSRTFRDIVGRAAERLPGAAGRCRRCRPCFAMALASRTEQFRRSTRAVSAA